MENTENGDTIELLKECNAGVKMGVDSIDDVLGNVADDKMRKLLADCKDKHQELGSETHTLLNRLHNGGKSPSAMARGMAHIKTNVMITFSGTDHTIADLMTDGCNMGVKSLHRYMNKYKAASDESRDIARRLIALESKLAQDLSCYL